uniref:PRELI/MSF1 domain-containing protein n=1 Tax=Ditylenchus dipsaci TaxID=166011 RepID=A0A915D9D3_9BILA
MVLTTRNLNCSGFLRVDESLIYKPHHSDPDRTQVNQKMAVTVNLPAFTDYCERAFLSAYQTNALKGRTGLEWVIDQLGNQLKREYTDLSSRVHQVSSEVHEFSDKLFSGRSFNSANSS